MLVTGYKTDIWLVKMVGLLSVAIGLSLLIRTKNPDKVLSLGAAAALLAIDVYYATEEVISPIYLLDACLQALLIIYVTLRILKVK